MNYNDVSYTQIPNDDECIVNAVQIAKRIGETPSTIRTWAGLYEEYLYIKKINGRFCYTEASVEQFQFIKELVKNKGMSHKQVEDIIKKQGFQYAKYDGGLISLEDPLGFQALASAIAIENKKQLEEFLFNFMQYQKQENDKLKKELMDEVSISIDEILEDKLREQKNEIQGMFDVAEVNNRDRDLDMIDKLHYKLEEKRKEELDNRGFWSRLFK